MSTTSMGNPGSGSQGARTPVPAQKVVVVTPFTESGNLDERALHVIVDRLAAFGLGLYLGSYGSGEGHLLSRGEIRAMYQIAVAASGKNRDSEGAGT
jgi:hypothetical protein